MTKLAEKICAPCKGGVPPLDSVESAKLASELPDWTVVNLHHLSRAFLFPDFAAALDFVNLVGELAEREKHHPDIFLSWGKAVIDIWTHKINGLSESDFVLAAKIDELAPE
jgi:4a-hydroxytetrahydrobiopterin dehydratase